MSTSNGASSSNNKNSHQSQSQSRVFAAYRKLFRARKVLFEGDHEAMRQSRVAIKQEFLKNASASVSSDAEMLDNLLFMADEAHDMMMHGIVRGDLNPRTGHYGT